MKNVIAITLFICLALLFSSCNESQSESFGILRIDINPSVYMIIDEDDNVLSFTPANEDARILLSKIDLLNISSMEAIELLITKSYELGYIDLLSTDNVIKLFGKHTSNKSFESDMLNEIQEHIETENLPVGLFSLIELEDISEKDVMQTMLLALGVTEKNTVNQLDQLKENIELEHVDFLDSDLDDYKDLFDAMKNQENIIVSVYNEQNYPVINYEQFNQQILDNYQEVSENITSRSLLKKNYAQSSIEGQIENYMIGTYVFELSVLELSYFVNFHNFILNSDGSYTESYSWTSKNTSMTVSSDVVGTWLVVDQFLELTNNNGYSTYYKIAGSRIYKEELSGNTVFYIKVN